MQFQHTDSNTIDIVIPDWPGFNLTGLRPRVWLDGQQNPCEVTDSQPGKKMPDGSAGRVLTLTGGVKLLLAAAQHDGRIEIRAWLENDTADTHQLDKIVLFEAAGPTFGQDVSQIVQYFQGGGRADVKPLRASAEEFDPPDKVEPNVDTDAGGDSDDQASPPAPAEQVLLPETPTIESQNVWLVYDRAAGRALLAGYLTGERWDGFVHVTTDAEGTVRRWSVEYLGGELHIQPGQTVPLESVTFLTGPDPYALLEAYGDRVAEHHSIDLPETPPVSWCSWYPYRLGVTEQRMLENARLAEQRLKPLGLSIIEVDLGWEYKYLPSAFEPNDQFPHGMKWLSEQLQDMGFVMGLWKAPYAVSEFDPVAAEHPDWLIRDEAGKPIKAWTWFWEPHGDVYCFDLTKPEVTEYLRSQFRRFREEYQLGYLKVDFSSFAYKPTCTARQDKSVVQGGGLEVARKYWQMMSDELPDALCLNCFGPQLPGEGQWPLLYCCQDTGNTGVLTWEFMRANFRSVAGVLWKNWRWGILQPSCLCVGLPGTLEEARIRATVAFCTGGQGDISDTLTTLPEDRWAVLEATLPPLGITAKAIDLFEPILDPGSAAYEAQCKGEESEIVAQPHTPGSVWQVRVEQPWDNWQLVAVFDLDNSCGQHEASMPKRYRIPLQRLGLDPQGRYWLSEFWSGQFLGELTGKRTNPGGYEHPGDGQDLYAGPADDGAIDIAFAGPAVKLLCIRQARQHPWVATTSFHQSGGAELSGVSWDESAGELRGTLNRPAGQSGFILLASAGWQGVSATVNGQDVPLVPAASGACKLPVITAGEKTEWAVRFRKD